MKRPCECGCSFNDHFEIAFKDKVSIFTCRECYHGGAFCYNYRPIGNLAWLEWVIQKGK